MIVKSSKSIKKILAESYEDKTDVMSLINKAKEKKFNEITRSIERINSKILNTPMINGYKLIKEPDPIPGEIDPVPIITWGEIASTPKLIKSEKKFQIPETPVREYLAHNLVNKNNNNNGKSYVKK